MERDHDEMTGHTMAMYGKAGDEQAMGKRGGGRGALHWVGRVAVSAAATWAVMMTPVAALAQTPTPAPEIMTHGRFENVPIFRPAGEPNATVLFFSDNDGWTPRAERMARALADTGALVAGIDTARLMANYTKDEIA
jgi:type IV secretory pathway VirJ component